MHEFIEGLMSDHARIRSLLNSFEDQLSGFSKAESPDYDILESGVDACVEYLDAVHHRKEERLLQRLLLLDPAAAAALTGLSDQHRELETLAHEVAASFAAARDDAWQAREPMTAAGRTLLGRYRYHLDWEEAQFFPAARRVLSHQDFSELSREWQEEASVAPTDASWVERMTIIDDVAPSISDASTHDLSEQ